MSRCDLAQVPSVCLDSIKLGGYQGVGATTKYNKEAAISSDRHLITARMGLHNGCEPSRISSDHPPPTSGFMCEGTLSQ
jgi:hypothetical protein